MLEFVVFLFPSRSDSWRCRCPTPPSKSRLHRAPECGNTPLAWLLEAQLIAAKMRMRSGGCLGEATATERYLSHCKSVFASDRTRVVLHDDRRRQTCCANSRSALLGGLTHIQVQELDCLGAHFAMKCLKSELVEARARAFFCSYCLPNTVLADKDVGEPAHISRQLKDKG